MKRLLGFAFVLGLSLNVAMAGPIDRLLSALPDLRVPVGTNVQRLSGAIPSGRGATPLIRITGRNADLTIAHHRSIADTDTMAMGESVVISLTSRAATGAQRTAAANRFEDLLRQTFRPHINPGIYRTGTDARRSSSRSIETAGLSLSRSELELIPIEAFEELASRAARLMR